MKRLLFLCFSLFLLGSAGEQALAEERVEGSPALRSQLLVDRGASLIGRRTISIEPGLDYTNISSNRLNVSLLEPFYDPVSGGGLFVGQLQVQKARRNVLVSSITLRAGVTSAFEIYLRIPYVYRDDELTYGFGDGAEIQEVDETGIGDIEGGINIHVFEEKNARPKVMFGMRIKSRTGKDPYELEEEKVPNELPLGSGHWALEPNISLVKTVDPAVLFFSLSYYMHLERETHTMNYGNVDPSDSIGYSLGMAYALNEKLALSTAFEQKFFNKAEWEVSRGEFEKILNTDVVLATLMMSGTYVIKDTLSVNASVGIGLTEDSPDLQVGIKFPMRFSGL